MAAPELVDRLAALKTFGQAPRAELEWLVAHGTLETFPAGAVLTSRGEIVKGMYVVLSGHITITVTGANGPNQVMDWRPGEVTGLLPYSRMVSPPGDTRAEEDTVVLAIPRADLHAMILECHEVTKTLVHTMIDRARTFTSSGLHDQNMISLGKLSAGLAHELNNPASAIERSATLLEERLEEAEMATRALGAARLSDEQLAAVDTVRSSCLASRVQGVRSPLEQAEREDAITEWLEDHGLDVTNAEALADTAVTFEALELIVGAVDRTAVNAVLKWAAAGCSVRGLASEIQEAATRIATLVLAIKGFTHMDKATVAEPVDLVQSLQNTVAVLRSKARHRSASVAVQTPPDLPKVLGFAGELNQIWANLIDNALDAIPDQGRVEVRAERDGAHVIVRVVDNGSGIPDSVREHIFDPFFTTKPVGQGTGLGLDIVRRLVRHNRGEISVESQPGHTEFRVELMVAEAAS